MTIRIKKTTKGLPFGRAVPAPGVTDMGASQVTVFLSVLDVHRIAEVVASLNLSAEEARGLAGQLIAAASEADAQAQKQASS